jgi:hypothetical protein
MLRISGHTMQAFEANAEESFKKRMAEHYRETFPWHYAMWGHEVTRRVVDHGCERARNYGFSTNREICLYLTLLPMLGGCFDEDFLFPWARQILTDPGIREPVVRINRLVAQAMEYLDLVLGPNNRYLHRAMVTLRRELPILPGKRLSPDFTMQARAFLKAIFSRKYEAHGEEAILSLIKAGIERAEVYGFVERRGQLLFIGSMFILGTHFDKDPQLPTFVPVLSARVVGRESRLQQVCVEFVDRWFTANSELSNV